MAVPGERAQKAVPAQLSFLALYNPALGQSDETFRDQIVFYYSKDARSRRKQDDDELREDENERLRQIGLAQGMIDFARSFSGGEPVNHVETEKSRIVMHELEKGWWVLASIDLTRLPTASSPTKASSSTETPAKPAVEYSSREVSPPDLLVQQLLRAHNIFRLHHGPSLYDLYVRLPRPKFCNILERFWTRFANTWDVLLHGSPAVEMYGGIKLAAGGELGMGVGEEEWGSGERDVLENFAARTEGLVDMVVSRFGEPAVQAPQDEASVKTGKSKPAAPYEDLEPWMGSGSDTESADGVIFSGVGTISRSSLRDVSNWMQWIYAYGDHTYGVKENPSSDRRRRPRRNRLSTALNGQPRPSRLPSREDSTTPTPTPKVEDSRPKVQSAQSQALPPGIPRPLVSAVESSLNEASSDAEASQAHDRDQNNSSSLTDSDTWMKVLTLGYGSSWGGNKRPQPPKRTSTEQTIKANQINGRESSADSSLQHLDPQPDVDHAEEALKAQVARENQGHFIIGLKGGLDNDSAAASDPSVGDNDGAADSDWNHRILLRTLHVKVKQTGRPTDSDSVSRSTQDTIAADMPPVYVYEKVRVVIYVHRPFVATLLFNLHTPTLSYPSFYRDLRAYLYPLYKPLTHSTSPARVAARIASASNPYTTTANPVSTAASDSPIFDLVFDPLALTVHSSIPSIPEPGTLGAEGFGIASGVGPAAAASKWTRVEALNVHSQILATVASTRRSPNDIERTVKTSRGWWLVWMRLPPSSDLGGESLDGGRDASLASLGGDECVVGGDRRESAGLQRYANPDSVMSGRKGGASSASIKPLASDESLAVDADADATVDPDADADDAAGVGGDGAASSKTADADTNTTGQYRGIPTTKVTPPPPADVAVDDTTASPNHDNNTTSSPNSNSNSDSTTSTSTARNLQHPSSPANPLHPSRSHPSHSRSQQSYSQSLPTASLREALLVRRARDAPVGHRGAKSIGGGGGLWRSWTGSGSAAGGGSRASGEGGGGQGGEQAGYAGGWGPRGLAEGVGVDARRYVEGLLSLSR